MHSSLADEQLSLVGAAVTDHLAAPDEGTVALSGDAVAESVVASTAAELLAAVFACGKGDSKVDVGVFF